MNARSASSTSDPAPSRLGIAGESDNYPDLEGQSKSVLTWLMLLGRLAVFVLLVLFVPRFWRKR